ncbi:MAG: hypothetical protein RR547_14340, partial [Raoultibacter sp.]
GKEINHPRDVRHWLNSYKRNAMAKSSLESAVWDLYAKQQNKPLHEVIGGTRSIATIGVSIGIQNSDEDLYEKIQTAQEAGFARVNQDKTGSRY